MFTYTLLMAMFLLFITCFLKKMMIYMALFCSWAAVIWVVADMSKTQDMSNSLGIQIVAGVIMAFAMLQFFKIRGENSL